ncbi:MAG: carbohydrate ABC transporter permease [Propionibacteriaceae bacterium]|jgi:alpha-glucoside transport system permease protein|nr:carbohydrate ABC transporter permease [Propionibacteriaceae bacterium]
MSARIETRPDADQRDRKKVRRAFSSPIASAFVILICVLWTVPTFGTLVTSFRPQADAAKNGWWNAFLHPNFTLANYQEVLVGSSGSNLQGGIFQSFINSLVITIPATIIPLALAAMAAYVLAWVRFKGSDIVFFTIFALQVVPLQMSLLPILQFFSNGVKIGDFQLIPPMTEAIQGFWGIWIAHCMFAMPLAIFLVHNFVSSLPSDIFEAATVDGAGVMRIFYSIVLPLIKPALASFGIFQFLWVWNDLLISKTFANSPFILPITYRIQMMTGSLGSRMDLLTAGAFVSMLVPLIVFFCLQKYFVRGLLAGSVKG